ncbi:MAG: hypothetical protein HOQ27_03535 [Dermatophilaceae bacterium]|nr:hypothetical protein [Dermatophilaceae bacterium]
MTAAFRVPTDVGVTVGADGRTVYVASLPAGPLVVLEGAAAVIWTEATAGPADGWLGRVARAVGRPEADVSADAEAFVADLCARGLVRPG